jgi:nucleotide-binding universal stress UspA family protein
LEQAALAWLPDLHLLETRVRQGKNQEILNEVTAGNYEMVVLGRPLETEESESAEDSLRLQRLLIRGGIPTLIVPATRERVAKILICTAAGEPGKSDVRFGGRVARRTRAEVTVFHVRAPGTTAWERERASRHLAKAQDSLGALGVPSNLKIEEGRAVDSILQESEAGDYDLIVVGAPAPLARQQLVWTDLASQVAAATTRPLLIVPMVEY